MKAPSLLIACALVLCSSMLMRASSADRLASAEPTYRSETGSSRNVVRRRALRRGRTRLVRVLRPAAGRTGRQRPRVRRLPHATDHFQLSPADVEARFQRPADAARATSRRRRSAVPADRRGRFPDQRRQRQRFQQSSPERSRPDHLSAAAEHQADRSGDQRSRRPRRSWTCGEPCRRSTTSPSPDPMVSIRGRAARTRSADTSWTPASRRCRSRRSARSPITRRSSRPPPQRLLDDLPSFQRVLFTNHSRARAGRRGQRGHDARCRIPIRRSNELEQQGKVVFERACSAVPRRPGPVERPGAGRALSRHRRPSVRVPSTPRRPRASLFAACCAATRPQCADLRDHVGQRQQDSPDELRSRPRVADRFRRRRSRAAGRLEQARRARRCAASARPRRTSTTTAPPRSKRSSITTSSSSSACR